MPSKFVALAAASAMMMAATAAQAGANPAARLSVADAGQLRAATPAKKASKISNTAAIVAVVAVIGAGIIIGVATSGDDTPDSP